MDHLAAWDKFGTLTYDDLPDHVTQVANQCILDWFGCALAGSDEELAKILRTQFGNRTGNCTVIGSDLKLEAPTAALLNGASGHALDYDDTGSSVGCHSTAPVLPAVLAVAEDIGATGKELITAFVVGVEVEGRINYAMGRDHYPKGWHTTATYGTFGATAAVAHLLKLSKDQYGIAMGLAVSAAMFAIYRFFPASVLAELETKLTAKVFQFSITSWPSYLALSVFYAFCHSFLEEYYYRWFIFGQVRHVTKLVPSMVISGLAFMGHHVIVLATFFGMSSLTIFLSLSIAVGGMIWAWQYEKSKSLIGPWISHLLVDAGIFAIGYDVLVRAAFL